MKSRYDVVIVGGGAIGSSIAYFLAAEPAFDGEILVAERDPTYEYCSSARATGGVRQQFSTPENIKIGLFGAHFVKHVGEFLSIDGEAPEIGFNEEGYLLLSSPAALSTMRANHAVQHAHGAEIEFLEPQSLGARYPWMKTEGLAGGFMSVRNEGWLDPFGLLQAFRRKARDLGVFYVADEVTDIARNGDRVTGISLKEGGEVSAGIVVDCAGARDAARMAATVGVALPVEPRKRCAFVVDCREDISPRPPLMINPNGVWIRPEGRTYLCGVSPPEASDVATWEFDVDYSLFEDMVWPTLAERIPALEALKMVRAYCCHYDFNTLDENAILGLTPALENFYIATGFSGHGLMQSPAVGRAITELITFGGYRTLDLHRFGYDRILTGEAIREMSCF